MVVFGSQSDEDWYSIDVTSGNEHVLASLRFHNLGIFGPGDNIDLDLELLDDNGNSQQLSNNSAAINEAIDFIVPAPGTYHLRVFGDNNGDGYALDWAGVSTGSSVDIPVPAETTTTTDTVTDTATDTGSSNGLLALAPSGLLVLLLTGLLRRKCC